MNCPRCAIALPEGAKFCSSCGEALAPKRVSESERRVVTVLFCDVKGSTTLAETLDPEEWSEIMDGAFRALTAPVSRYEGTVARLMGDAVLAYFGAPLAHEDDPERAILAALDMRAAAAGYRERLRAERGIGDFDIRVGINTGLAVVGDVGGQGIEYSAMGDAVNVAARLQSAAPPGGILVGDATQKRVAGLFELKALGALEVKGRSAPVEAFQVLARAHGREAARRAALVGRESEMAALRGAAEDVRSGRGRIVSLIADAGLGKSRLIEELHGLRAVDGSGAATRWSEARAQSYGASRSFLLFREHLLQWAGAVDGDDAETVRAKVWAIASDAVAARGEIAKRGLELLLGVETSGEAELSAEGVRAELFALVAELVRRRFTDAPGVLVFDDLQWSDPISVELLLSLFALADEIPVLFVCAFRPDRQSPAWKTKQRAEGEFPHLYTELMPPPLAEPDAGALLRGILGGTELPERLRERILAKAEGNPLFLEEIVRALLQDGVVVHEGDAWRVTRDEAEIGLPETLQGLLAARIDRLEEETRRTLQAAAVIGRSFAYRVLRMIDESERLDRHLTTLQRVELLRELGREPERVFGFRHALTQEAAYGSILQRRRRDLHKRVAEALSELYGDRAEEQAELIGHHFAEAADARAIAPLKVAGERAMRLYALDEAIALFSRAIAMTKQFETPTSTLTELYGPLARAHELRGEFDAALGLYDEMERIARERGDPSMELTALAARVTIHAIPTPRQDHARAEELLARALPVAREGGHRALLARLLWAGMAVRTWRGDKAGAIAAADEATAIARELGLRELQAYVLSDSSWMFRAAGQPEKAVEQLAESAEIFRALGNKPMLANSLTTMAGVHATLGRYDEALRATDESRRLSDETKNFWGQSFSDFMRGYVLYDLGDWGGAIETWEEGVRLGEPAGFMAVRVGPRSDLGWLYHESGSDAKAEEHLRAATELAERSMKGWLSWPTSQTARLLIAQGDLDGCRALVARGREMPIPAQMGTPRIFFRYAEIEIALAEDDGREAARLAREALGAAPVLFGSFDTDLHWYEGEGLRLAGDHDAAAATLAEGLERVRELGAKRLLWRLLASLSAVEEARGNVGAAVRARTEAVRIVEQIASSLERVGLAEAFRTRPEVAALL